jgi:hypothetical protein
MKGCGKVACGSAVITPRKISKDSWKARQAKGGVRDWNWHG